MRVERDTAKLVMIRGRARGPPNNEKGPDQRVGGGGFGDVREDAGVAGGCCSIDA